MARRRVAAKREVLPDPKYKSGLVAKFICRVMIGGKKSVAEGIVYRALEVAYAQSRGKGSRDEGLGEQGESGETSSSSRSLAILEQALENVGPLVEVRARRIGGSTYQIPVEVRLPRRRALAMRWLIAAAKKRAEKNMAERLGREIAEAAASRGTAIKKREDTHKMAEANKAFAHYRW